MVRPRGRIRALLAGIPRFLHLLARLVGDPRVSQVDKAILVAAVAYTLAPLDLIADLLPILGQLDDLFFLALAIDRLMTNAGAALVRAHWDGPDGVLETLCGSIDDLARRVPAPVRRRIRKGVAGR
ncbi:MAG: hypothetical protein AMS25_00600 [Gemmatimonas sp. SM23_52]|nr:MAG: hypothetical protein AMS25_00600 [Gemmatimonas sp. SM23_52]